MKVIQIIILLSLIQSFGCDRKHTPNNNSYPQKDSASHANTSQVSHLDTLVKIDVDGYSVTNEMFSTQRVNANSGFEKESGQTLSLDQVWFSNDILKQTLIFELYTDYHRLISYQFYNSDIPLDLIEEISLANKDREQADIAQKLKDFSGFLKQAKNIDDSYFVTEKGIKLGDTKQKVLSIYGGVTHEKILDKGVEKLEWEFVGDEVYNSKMDLKGKPLAKNSFGHKVTMYFQKGKLIAQILFNEIP